MGCCENGVMSRMRWRGRPTAAGPSRRAGAVASSLLHYPQVCRLQRRFPDDIVTTRHRGGMKSQWTSAARPTGRSTKAGRNVVDQGQPMGQHVVHFPGGTRPLQRPRLGASGR